MLRFFYWMTQIATRVSNSKSRSGKLGSTLHTIFLQEVEGVVQGTAFTYCALDLIPTIAKNDESKKKDFLSNLVTLKPFGKAKKKTSFSI